MTTTDTSASAGAATVPAPIPADAIRIGESRTLRFEGVAHGSNVSFFLVTSDPGQGPSLHRHPYDETWSVLEGEATIVVGDRTFVARAGDTAVAPADTWHRFTNSGTGTLRIVCIHASPVMIQEFAPEA
ncbi:cupin domain-containing protein [Promicromonospora thailandica]|uniref:Mannose-6-phosphate isomerase, cupin superfamily n=1 Tax=Promicromonospora thailandica TaxID=765201 RepID=A0A9X2G3Q1_9MICO|nr:cupin domain-containing protein [Promicromonospora thailandica]MCP2262749.1 Mannose-6-phosphate isomerase, cupin superfamily [Promicromonospora thailandica]BFF18074.1 cupin domain-containing protein [Promicromonospora thailandica]